MPSNPIKVASLAIAGAGLIALSAGPAPAQSSLGSREFQQAELAELSPELRREVESRVGQGNTPRGVLETMLLNQISVNWPASRIVATDMGRGVAVIAQPDNTMKALRFNKQDGLKVVGEVSLAR